MNNTGLIYGYYFNETDNATIINSEDVIDLTRSSWLHFDYSFEETKRWLNEHSQLDPVVINALLSEETRPRATIVNEGLLISLRGVNLAPNSNPEDMVSIRIWLEKSRIVSSRRRLLLSVSDIVSDLNQGAGPKSPAQLFVQLTERLMFRMADTINDLEDKVLAIEENILANNSFTLRSELADLRRQVIALRRYLSPQREAMQQLQSEKINLFSNDDKIRLREVTDQLIRFVEDLDSIRDRATVTQEEVSNRLNEQMNNRMYVLSIVAAIFLPLGFLTGLLGINVGGIPGADNTSAFSLFIIFLVIVVAIQVWLFKKNKWF